MERSEGDILFVLDLDRTLIDVNAVMDLSEKVCQELGIDFSDIEKGQLVAAEEAIPYSPLEAIDQTGRGNLAKFKKRFLELAEPEKLMFADAKRLLMELDKHHKQYLILTYAIDEGWQKLKLKAVHLDKTPHVITFNAMKSRDIVGWWDQVDNTFVPPVASLRPAKQLWYIDDRVSAFNYFPENCEGFHLDRQGAAEKMELPANIKQIKSLDQLIDKI